MDKDKFADMEKDIRILKRDNSILIHLVSILFCLVNFLLYNVDGLNAVICNLGSISYIVIVLIFLIRRR